MANYKEKMLKYGSYGGDVKDLQNRLNQAGYKLAVDGQFGGQTTKAVQDYQKKNGLTQDGVVGEETWGQLTGGSSSGTKSFTASDLLAQKPGEYSSKYQAQVDEALSKKPGNYSSQNQQQIDTLYDQIVNRQPFNFDLNANALYQQYRDQYQRLGQQAMADTMGQAAGLTGGYGSTYGQSVGQQAYNAYLQELNNIVPDLYAQARSEYDTEGQNLYNLYGLASDRESQDYNRFMDSYNRWLQDYQMAEDRENQEYSRYNDAYTRWLQMYGTLQEQENWQKQMDFQREQWEWQKAQAGSSGSSGRSGGSYGGSSGSSGASQSDELEGSEMMYAGGFTSSDLAGIAQSYYNSGMPYGTSSSTLRKYLASIGLDSQATQVVIEYIKGLDNQIKEPKNTGGGSTKPGSSNKISRV